MTPPNPFSPNPSDPAASDSGELSNFNGAPTRQPAIDTSPHLHSATLAPGASEPPLSAGEAGENSAQLPELFVAGRSVIAIIAILVVVAGIVLNNTWMQLAGSTVAVLVALRILWRPLKEAIVELLPDENGGILIGILGGVVGTIGFLQILGVNQKILLWFSRLNWDAVGALGEVFGALGQILIAVLAVYIAWRQYVISKDLTIQQNTITQQQTIDTYFQGISDLVLDEEGLLEDWPQERSIAEGRTAAILSSVNAEGKAKIVRFLSRANLLTPLRRDRRLGRAILDGRGGYEEDRLHGTRVIDLGVMLAGADLSCTDLRWTDLSDANLIRANLKNADLVKANLSRTILFAARLRGADLNGARLFYGRLETATPRSRTEPPDYKTGAHTGAVVENVDLTGVKQLSEEQRCYFCAWGGSRTRSTVPGGCHGIPNRLGR